MRPLYITFLMFIFVGSAHAGSVPPVSAFADTEKVSLVSISPSGDRMAFYLYTPERAHIIVNQVAGKNEPVSFDVGDQKVRSVQWVGNNHILAVVSKMERFTPRRGKAFLMETRRAISLNIKTGKIIRLLENTRQQLTMGRLAFRNTNLGRITGIRHDAKTVLIPARTEMGSFDLFEVSVKDGAVKRSFSGLAGTVKWAVDQNGTPIARVNRLRNPNRSILEVKNDKGWQNILQLSTDLRPLQLNGLATDGNTVVASLVLDNDNFIRPYAVNPQTGEMGSPLSQVQGYDMGQAILDPYTNAVVGSHYIEDKTETVFFDPELAAIFAKLQASFAGKSLQLVSWNQARTVFIVAMNTPGAPLSYYLYRPAEKKFSRISASRPTLTKAVLGQSRPYTYSSRDGTQIKGYLTMPSGNKKTDLPLVTLMHNGPFARSAIDYNWMAQMLAANGYAVFQSNFRGSAGYGNAFHDAGYGQWGNTIRHDIDDGVKALVAQGIANPQKVCIFGSGFGGYSALLTASLSPDLYACTGAYAAISNPATYMGNIKRRMGNRSRTVIRLEHIFQGEDNSTALDDISPAAHAQNIKAKVLLMHSRDDRQIQIGQSRTMLRKLKNAGVDVTFVELDGSDHDLDQEEARIKVGKVLLAFLKTSL